MNTEKRYINAIKNLEENKGREVVRVLKEIKGLKERGYDETNNEVLGRVIWLREVLGLK